MDKSLMQASIQEKATTKDGGLYITCHAAFEIAEQYNVAPNDVGKICDELGIKITNCQLECF